jgi:hypothetical protein
MIAVDIDAEFGAGSIAAGRRRGTRSAIIARCCP